jgi:excisionase family DNA binding protein
MKKFLTTSQVAKVCQVSPGSVIRWIEEGRLKSAVTPGGHRRVEVQEVVRLLEALRIEIPPELKSEGQEEAPSPFRVLIIDDELGMRQMLRSFFEEHYPHFHVEEAPEGFVAGWKAHSLRPHLVLLDLRLPGLDGFRVCHLIRSFPGTQQAHIIAMTAYEEDGAKEKILGLGANDFLNKPFDLDTLKQKVERQVQKYEQGRLSNISR